MFGLVCVTCRIITPKAAIKPEVIMQAWSTELLEEILIKRFLGELSEEFIFTSWALSSTEEDGIETSSPVLSSFLAGFRFA